MAISMFITVPLSANITSISSAINKAGKQRMITQRMLKNYAMVGMNNTYGNPKEDLKKMITLFDKNLSDLNSFIKDAKSLDMLKKVDDLWHPVKKLLQKTPTKDKVLNLQVDLDVLLETADRLTKQIAKVSKTRSANIVNLAGKQRMLSQRMASLYMLKVWEVNDIGFLKKLKKSMTEFSNAQKELIALKTNTKKIDKLLAKSAKAFRFFEMTSKTKSTKYIPSLINRSANKILENMDKATNLYADKK